MKNMKMTKKLVFSFAIVILMLIIVGVVGIYGITTMDEISSDMYLNKAKPLGELATGTEYFQRIRVQTRNAIIYTGDEEQLKTVDTDLHQRIDQFRTSMRAYEPSIASDKGQQLYDRIIEKFNNIFEPGVLKVLEDAKLGKSQSLLLEDMVLTTEAANIIANDLAELTATRMNVMSEANDEGSRRGSLIFAVIIIVIIFAIAVSMFLAVHISKLISRPAKFMKNVLSRIGAQGDLDFTDAEYSQTEAFAAVKDEIGESVAVMLTMVRRLVVVGHTLETVASGDLTAKLDLLSEKDVMGKSLMNMLTSLRKMFGEIDSSTEQVSLGSRQVADGSQSLAQGSTEQAAAVEQLSSSISEIASNTKVNADMADKAAKFADTIKINAEKGNRQMSDMISAVQEINHASQNISNVIKVIDDIAFQTNILALNAAVEAARAGQNGKGFAVVAEEVRNLAAKSAEAAKNTEGLIANSMEKAELGANIANMTAESLNEIVAGIGESTRIVSEIAKSSREQLEAIVQVNQGIEQVAQVVQQNSATAEESAAASQEMNGQSEMLRDLVAQFKTR